MAPTEHRTTCNRDCPDTCGIIATVENGEVVGLRGDPEHPVTKGFLCYRTSRFAEHQEAPYRLRRPLIRKHGELVEVSMAEALDFTAENLLRIREESGPASIFHYRSGGSLGMLKLIADRFFEQFGPCATKIGDICSGAGEAAQEADFGISESNDLFDLENSRFLYLWGKNPFVSHLHLIPVVKAARAKGTRVTLLDPVHHRGASLADRVLAPRPGTDAEIALGIARILVDSGRVDPAVRETCDHYDDYVALVRSRTVEEYAAAADLPAEVLAEMADEFAEGPAAIMVGWGMQRRAHGASAIRALDALSAITGNLFRSGGGCSFYVGRRTAFDSTAMWSGRDAAPRHIREPMFAADVAAASDPPVRAIWVTAGNPVAMLPDSAAVAEVFEKTEFTVVVDPFLTDTGRRATVVFPAPTLLEDSDVLGAYGHHWLAESKPVIPAPEGVLHEVDLFRELGERVGLGDAMAGSIDDHKRRLLRRVEDRGITLESMASGAVRNPFARPVAMERGAVETETGRVQLLTEVTPREDDAHGYPMWLFSNSTEKSQASQWAIPGLGDLTWVRVHPEAVPGKAEGATVSVESEHGRVQAELRLDDSLRRDVAVMPKGGHYDRGHSANALIAARPTDLGLGAAYLDCRVRIV